jgi:hypothetical protein
VSSERADTSRETPVERCSTTVARHVECPRLYRSPLALSNRRDPNGDAPAG